jgi:energy-coupling factor transporter ATP-binding protein EcfA2
MAISVDIPDLLRKLASFRPGRPLENFIGEATFPNFKGLAPGAKIAFEFPITVIVGPNGSGKSSILHALWGMPIRKSTSRFWFSTAVDPIAEGGVHGVPRYHYKHWISALNRYVETRKVRVGRRRGYWEPARALVSDGMAPMPAPTEKTKNYRSADRWTPTVREVKYLNLKCEFSAFDRVFYFADRSHTLEERQKTIAKDAKKLARVIQAGLQSYKPGGHQAVFENRELTQIELEWVSYILGREYISARYVLHRLYGHIEAPTVVFKRPNLTYSEAFAGSGELAVVRAVIEILSYPKYTLVLLDEPETSLHPGAQERFLGFLLETIRTQHLQVVISTHSPTLVNLLPPSAIRTLEETVEGKMQIVEVTHPEAAFNVLGHRSNNKITIVVEDALLTSLVQMAIKLLTPGEQSAIVIHTPSTGADTILTYDIPVWMAEKRNIFVILDGDQDPGDKIDFAQMTAAQKLKLGTMIHSRFKVKPLHVGDGKEEPALSYLKWVEDRVRFLSAVCPEQVLLEQLVGAEEAKDSASDNKLAKANLIARLEKDGHPTDAQALKVHVGYILPNGGRGNPYIEKLVLTLRDIIKFDVESRVVKK